MENVGIDMELSVAEVVGIFVLFNEILYRSSVELQRWKLTIVIAQKSSKY